MKQAQRRTLDAYSASPAIRLRHRILCAKASAAPQLAPVPPAVGGETLTVAFPPTSSRAFAEGDPRAVLMRLREEAADEIDRLLEFLDLTDGDTDLEPDLGYYNAKKNLIDGEMEAGNEREMENEHGEVANGSGLIDDEPSLCGVGSHVVQGIGNDHDGEPEPYPYQKDNAALRARIQRDRKTGNIRLLDGSVPPPGSLLTMEPDVYVVSPVPQ